MKKFYLLLVAMLCGVVATRAQEVNTSWSVGTGANDKANITWIGFAVPEVNDEGDAVTEVPLHNIHLCTNKNNSAEKTAYMVISSTKDINGKVGISTNKPEPQNNAFVEYLFEDITLQAGSTYYMFFSTSNTNVSSCGQRIAISNANGNYEPKVYAGGEKTWLPYFKVNVPDANALPPIFSATYGEKWLRLSNCNNSSYAWSAPSASKAGTAQMDMSQENQLFCFVGNNTDGFVIYSKTLGEQYKLTASTSPGNGTAASWTTGTAAKWFLDMSQNSASEKPGIGITTKVSSGQSLNMYGGAGGDLKFYGITDGGSRWTISRINPDPVNIAFAVTGETKYPETNTRIGEFRMTYGSTTSTTTVTKELDGQKKKMYLPYGQKVSMSTWTYHGWKGSVEETEEGTTVTFAGDMESEYQYLWYHNNPPYRIPAIAKRKDGKLLAINDYRPCGGDIGFGRVDLVQRIGSPDGTKWEKGTTIITGNEKDSWNGNDGFGDPAICIDRETGRVLLMAVTGHTVCGSATRQNPNRMARFYSEDGGETYHSMTEGRDSIYDDITEEFYSLWDTEAYKAGDKTSQDQYTAQSFFIGSGRIFQSSKIKVGEYYRIYAALWSKDMHNRVAYSDDFGMTWHILGTRQDMPFPNFGNANEPKCEELPNGDVIMSARKPNGRYYNIFTYSDIEKGQGSWGTGTNSNISAPSDWNGTNGEITTYQVEDVDGNLCNIALQSLPLGLNEYPGDVRRNVGFYYKDITSPTSYQKAGKNDVATFANGWQKGMVVSTTQTGSAYSTFTLQNDGRIGFFYEETPGGYSMVYVSLSISEITNGKYVRIVGDAQPTDATPVEITYAYTNGQTVWYEQKEVAYVGDAFPAIQEPAYVSATGLPERKVAAEDAGKTFPIACTLNEDIPFLPSVSFDEGVWYSLTIRGNKYISYDATAKQFPCATAKPSGDKALFAFVGNPYAGYKIQNLALGEDKAVGGDVANNAHVSPVDFESAPTFVLENNSGVLVLRNTANSLGYLNDVNSKLGYWVTSQAATDGGSSLAFTLEQNNATGIVETEPKVDARRGQSQIYDLSGRRLTAPQKGVNIVNGKKVVIK